MNTVKIPSMRFRSLAPSFVAGLFLAHAAQAAIFDYNANADANWSVIAPAATVGDTLNVAADITANRTINLNVPATIGHLWFEDVNRSHAWSMAGTETLTFDNTGMTPATLSLINSKPDFNLNRPVVLEDDLEVDFAMSNPSGGNMGSLLLNNNLDGKNHGLSFTGSGGWSFLQSGLALTDLNFINWNALGIATFGSTTVSTPLTNSSSGLIIRQGLVSGQFGSGSGSVLGLPLTLAGDLEVDARGVEPVYFRAPINASALTITGSGLQPKYFYANNIEGGPDVRNTVWLMNFADNALSGDTSVTGAMLYLDFGSNVSGSYSTGRKVNPSGTLTLNAATLQVDDAGTGTIVQDFGATVIGPGQSDLNIKRDNVNTTVNLGAVSRQEGGMATFRYTSAPNGTNNSFITTTAATNGLLGGWAFYAVGGAMPDHFASLGTGGLIAAPGSNGAPAYTVLSGLGGGTGVENFNYANPNSLILSGSINANSLRFDSNNSSFSESIDNNGHNITLTSGGLLLVNSGNTRGYVTMKGAGTIGAASANQPLFVNVRSNFAAIDSPLIGSGSGALYKSGYGKLAVTADAAYTGGTWINGGVLDIGAHPAALSSGNLRLSNQGQLGANGTFTRAIGSGAGEVSFLTGGGGFSAEGGPLTVNLGGSGASLGRNDINGVLALNNPVSSTHPVTVVNPVDTTGGVAIAVGANLSAGYGKFQNNNGAAYAVLQGGTLGSGDLLVYGFAQTPSNPNNPHFGNGLLVTQGNLAHTGQTLVYGSGLYVPPGSLPTLLATKPLNVTGGGFLATSGTLNINIGTAPGEISINPKTTFTGDIGFAAVGAPLVVTINGGATLALESASAPQNFFLGSAFSVFPTTLTNNMSGNAIAHAIGPVPVEYAGNYSGTGALILGFNAAGTGIWCMSGTNNTFASVVVPYPSQVFRAGGATAFGAAGGGFNNGTGTYDFNGYSFTGEQFSVGGTQNGTLDIGRLTNYNRSTASTLGDVRFDNLGGGAVYFGGDGNLLINGNLTTNGTLTTGGVVQWRGNGLLTLKGHNAGTFGGTNQKYFTRLGGGSVLLDYSSDTAAKLVNALGSATLAASDYALSLTQNHLTMLGHAGSAAGESLLGDVGTGGMQADGGYSRVSLTSTGAALTGNLQRIVSNNRGLVDFSVDTSGGGTAAITTETLNNSSGLIGGWATWNKADYAINTTGAADGALGAFTAWVTNNDLGTWTTGETTEVLSIDGAATGSLSAHTRLGGLRFNTGATNSSLVIDGGVGLTLGASADWGSIIVAPETSAHLSITGGSLNSGGSALGVGDTQGATNLAIHHHGSGTLAISSKISGTTSVGIVKSGLGTLELTGANTFGGNAEIVGGVLSIPSLANAGISQPAGKGTGASGDIRLYGNATLSLTPTADQATDRRLQLMIGGGTLDLAGTPGVTVTFNGSTLTVGTNSFVTAVYRNQDSDRPDFTITGASNATFNGSIILATPTNATFAFASPGLYSLVDPASLGQLILNGTGTITLNAPTNIQGGVLLNSGTLVLGHAIDTLSNNAPVTVAADGELHLAADVSDHIGLLTVQGGVVSGESGSQLLPLGIYLESGVISANLGGPLARIIKTTSGQASISGTNTFAQGIEVQAGELTVAPGAFGTGDLLIAAGALVQGTGQIAGSVRNDGSLILETGVTDSLSISGSYTQGAGATLSLEIAGSGDFNQVLCAGSISLAGALTIVLADGYTPANGATFDILIGTALSGTFASSDLPQGFALTDSADRVTLTYTQPGGYSNWAAGYPGLGEPGADDDGDGLTNFVEYIFSLNPLGAQADSAAYLPRFATVTDPSQALRFTYRRPAVVPSDVSYYLELSNDLTNWASAQAGVDYTEEASGGDPQTITVTLSLGVDQPGGYRFAKVGWVRNE